MAVASVTAALRAIPTSADQCRERVRASDTCCWRLDTVIAAIDANHPNLTNQKILYVEISRARDRAELVTEDKAALREQLQALTGERIAALEAVGDGKAKAPEAGTGRGMDAEIARERGTGRKAEPENIPESKSVDRDFGL